jgi:hypothetical protein
MIMIIVMGIVMGIVMISLLKCFDFYYVIFLNYYEENVLMGSL